MSWSSLIDIQPCAGPDPTLAARSHCIQRIVMHGLTISSSSLLVFILTLSNTLVVAAPRAAVSPVPPKAAAAINVLESALNVRSASCKIRGACSVLSPPDTCCGTCILVDSLIVSQDTCSQLRLTSQHILINFLFVGLLQPSRVSLTLVMQQ